MWTIIEHYYKTTTKTTATTTSLDRAISIATSLLELIGDEDGGNICIAPPNEAFTIWATYCNGRYIINGETYDRYWDAQDVLGYLMQAKEQ